MSRKLAFVVAGLLAIVLAAGSAVAQQPKGRPGGFGGGAGGPGGGRGGLVSLLSNAAVQKELGIGEAEVAKLRPLADEFRTAAQSELQAAGINFGDLQNLSQEERQTKLAEMQTKTADVTRKLTEKFEPKLAEVLSADQLKRLKEINVQAAGLAAFSDPVVVKELGLTDDQKKQIADIQANLDKSRQELFSSGGGDFQARMTKGRELSTEAEAKANGLLTDSQKTTLAGLKGKEFDIAQLRGGPGGPGGRPGGQGAPGAPGGRPGAPGGRPGAPGGAPGGRPGANPAAAPQRPATE